MFFFFLFIVKKCLFFEDKKFISFFLIFTLSLGLRLKLGTYTDHNLIFWSNRSKTQFSLIFSLIRQLYEDLL